MKQAIFCKKTPLFLLFLSRCFGCLPYLRYLGLFLVLCIPASNLVAQPTQDSTKQLKAVEQAQKTQAVKQMAQNEDKHVYNLVEVYELALKSDPVLKAAISNYKAQKEYVPQAVANFLPQLYAQAMDTWVHTGQLNVTDINFADYNTQSYTLNLAQRVLHFELFSQLKQASQIKVQAFKTYLAADQDLMIRTADRYFAVLAAEDNVTFSEAQRKAFFKQHEQAQHRFEVGLIAITDVLESKAAYDNAIAVEIAAKNERSDRYEDLREIAGQLIPQVAGIPTHKTIPLPEPIPKDQEAWVNTACVQNLEIQIDTAAAKAAKANIQTQRAGNLPSIDLTAQIGYAKPTPPSFPEFVRNGAISLTATLPIFEGGAVLSRTRQAKALYCEALQNLDHRRRVVESQTRQSYRGVLTNISETHALKQSVISNKQAVDSIQAGYNAGVRTLLDILNAQSTLFQVQRDYANARYNYLLEGLKLKRVAGTLVPCDLVHVNQFLEK